MISSDFHEDRLGYDVQVGYHNDNFIPRYRTACCALGSLSMNNTTTVEQIKVVIDSIKKENETTVESLHRWGGERAVFVITLPHEKILESNLKEFGFEMIYEFHRRNCYPEDEMLKMWIYSW